MQHCRVYVEFFGGRLAWLDASPFSLLVFGSNAVILSLAILILLVAIIMTQSRGKLWWVAYLAWCGLAAVAAGVAMLATGYRHLPKISPGYVAAAIVLWLLMAVFPVGPHIMEKLRRKKTPDSVSNPRKLLPKPLVLAVFVGFLLYINYLIIVKLSEYRAVQATIAAEAYFAEGGWEPGDKHVLWSTSGGQLWASLGENEDVDVVWQDANGAVYPVRGGEPAIWFLGDAVQLHEVIRRKPDDARDKYAHWEAVIGNSSVSDDEHAAALAEFTRHMEEIDKLNEQMWRLGRRLGWKRPQEMQNSDQ